VGRGRDGHCITPLTPGPSPEGEEGERPGIEDGRGTPGEGAAVGGELVSQ